MIGKKKVKFVKIPVKTILKSDKTKNHPNCIYKRKFCKKGKRRRIPYYDLRRNVTMSCMYKTKQNIP